MRSRTTQCLLVGGCLTVAGLAIGLAIRASRFPCRICVTNRTGEELLIARWVAGESSPRKREAGIAVWKVGEKLCVTVTPGTKEMTLSWIDARGEPRRSEPIGIDPWWRETVHLKLTPGGSLEVTGSSFAD